MGIERLRIQQEHVDGIQRELDEVRKEISNLESAQRNATDRLKEWEERAKLETGAERDSVEQELKQTKLATTSIEREMQALRARESDLAIRLEEGRSRLGELNDQLDSLKAELEKP